ncbi:hypothetical protein EB001_23340 [bacterium]|nr:hypothetical protein [bacterium]
MLELVIERVNLDDRLEHLQDNEQKGVISALLDAIKADIRSSFLLGARMKYRRLNRILSTLHV